MPTPPPPGPPLPPARPGGPAVTHPFKLVTVVAEPAIEGRLTADLVALGATGYTVVEARGRGTHGRAREFPGANLRIEAVVPPEVAERILAHLAAQYFADYAITAYVSDVAVVRAGQFGGGRGG